MSGQPSVTATSGAQAVEVAFLPLPKQSGGVIERVLLVTGTVGVGKTTIAEAISRQLAETGDPHAWVDLDKLSELWPPPEDDLFNTRVTTELDVIAHSPDIAVRHGSQLRDLTRRATHLLSSEAAEA